MVQADPRRHTCLVIRILIVDDHPAVRAGLAGVLERAPGLIPVGGAPSEAGLWPMLYRTRADVVLLDYRLGAADGLALCRRLKANVPAPRVVLYSAFADEPLHAAATEAGADALVSKEAPVHDLFETLRTVGTERPSRGP
jgi:DNA-binding NarL/FixJ family response regulator